MINVVVEVNQTLLSSFKLISMNLSRFCICRLREFLEVAKLAKEV